MAKVIINLKYNGLLMSALIVLLFINEFVKGRTILNSKNAIIKTIECENGEFIDCFDMYKQPAFDHPLLRNHTIQMRPSSYPSGMRAINFESDQLMQTWHKFGNCPQGTVPIRRARKNYSQKLSRKPRYNKDHRFGILDASNRSTHEYATVYVIGDNFNGIESKINLWKPLVSAKSEFSISQIWIVAGSLQGNTLNTAEAGWMVNSDFYGDSEPRLFLGWTSDNYQNTGCMNTLCPGFVQTNSQVALGATFTHVSLYNSAQYDATFRIFRDQGTGNWWFELQGAQIGYWPKSIYTTLNQGGAKAEWGGEIVNLQQDGRHTMTQMGSGHFSSEGYGKASYFRNLGIVDGKNQLISPSPSDVHPDITNSNCYDIAIEQKIDPVNGATFYYGGPGYSDNCP